MSWFSKQILDGSNDQEKCADLYNLKIMGEVSSADSEAGTIFPQKIAINL